MIYTSGQWAKKICWRLRKNANHQISLRRQCTVYVRTGLIMKHYLTKKLDDLQKPHLCMPRIHPYVCNSRKNGFYSAKYFSSLLQLVSALLKIISKDFRFQILACSWYVCSICGQYIDKNNNILHKLKLWYWTLIIIYARKLLNWQRINILRTIYSVFKGFVDLRVRLLIVMIVRSWNTWLGKLIDRIRNCFVRRPNFC